MNGETRTVIGRLVPTFLLGLFLSGAWSARSAPSPANRLTYLDEFSDPFYPAPTFPKLTTPQWIGEDGVEIVVTYGIDDMSGHANYERYLRPMQHAAAELGSKESWPRAIASRCRKS